MNTLETMLENAKAEMLDGPTTSKMDFNEPLETGTYTTSLNHVVFNKTEDPWQLNWEFVITEGKWEKRRVWSNQRFSEKGMVFILKNMEALGYDKDDFKTESDFDKAVEAINGMDCLFELYVKQKPPHAETGKIYTNVYINGTISKGHPGIGDAKEDQIPF